MKTRVASTKEYYAGMRAAVLILLGGKCVREACTVTDSRMLTIDHTHGGGVQHRKRTGGSRHYLTTILRELRGRGGKGKYRLLCQNHNWLAHISKGRKV